MNELFLAEHPRRRRVAEQLIEACRAECVRRDARRLTWQTAPDNHRAQAVYDRIGATREQLQLSSSTVVGDGVAIQVYTRT
jgi:RimJ/RimL family protein N-acetyltransferase